MRGMFGKLGKQKIRRMFAAVLAVCVLAGAVAWPEGAEEVRAENLVEGDFQYDVLIDGTVEILKYTGSAETLEIPDQLAGKDVSKINAYTVIDDKNNLKELTIPSSVNDFGERFPYFNCPSLKNIFAADNAAYSDIDGVLFDKGQTEIIRCPQGREGSYEIPSRVKHIKMCAFDDCVNLSEIIIPPSITEIGERSIWRCHGLSKITIPSSVENIDSEAFSDCSNWEAISVEAGNLYFSSQDGILYNKDRTELVRFPEAKKQITIAESVKRIGVCAFAYYNGLQRVIIPEGVEYIDLVAFQYSRSLKEIVIPKSVNDMGIGIFNACINLEKAIILGNISDLSSNIFRNCVNLTSVSIPASVSEIRDNAFEGCNSLTDIYFAGTKEQWENVKINETGNDVLDKVTVHYESELNPGEKYDYKELSGGGLELTKYNGSDTEVVVPGEIDGKPVQNIASGTFSECSNLTKITIPAAVSKIWPETFKQCPNLTAIEVMDGNASYSSVDGVIYSKDKTEVIRCPEGKTGEFAVISSTKKIGSSSFSGCKNLADIVIPLGVETIKDSAFDNCSSLIRIEIPASVTNIDSTAFKDCDQLAAINVDRDNLNYASDQGVLHNKDLTKLIRYPGGKKDGCSILPSVNVIGPYAFAYSKEPTEITIPDHVTEIEKGAFCCCEKLNKILISSKVNVIRRKTFENCASLKEVNIPNSVNSIEELAFCGCSALTAIKIPDTVTSIGGWGFHGCKKLRDIQIPDSVNSIETALFQNCSALTAIQIPDAVTRIERYAFNGCESLTEITIPEGIDGLNECIFQSCYNLSSVTIPSSVKSIKNRVFFKCNSLKDINYLGTRAQWEELCNGGNIEEYNEPLLNAAVHCIDDPAPDDSETDYEYIELEDETIEITGYAGIGTEIEIPAQIAGRNVSSIGEGAFEDCTKLTKVIIPEGVRKIKDEAFASCSSLMEIEIPASITDIAGAYVFHECTKLNAIHVNADNQNYASDDGVLFNKDMTTLIRFPAAGKTGIYSIPTGVSCIGDYAFGGCIGLTQVIIPDSVNDIGRSAFENCVDLEKAVIPKGVDNIKSNTFFRCPSLSEIVIPDSVTSIEMNVFMYCTNLSEIIIPESIESIGDHVFDNCTSLVEITIPDNVSRIGVNAFWNCSSLKKITLSKKLDQLELYVFGNCTALEKITIPESVSSIGKTFVNCKSLNTITIPISVERIGESAFARCSSLKDVYYQGKEEQWKKIAILEGNDSLINAIIHFIDGTTLNGPEEEEYLNTAKKELQKLKTGDPLSLDKDLLNYLSPQQIDIIESYIYTWLAEINYAYKYQGSSEVKRRLMGRTGQDPEEDFSSGSGRAVTHITVDTKYGPKSIEIVLDIGKPDGSGNLYPAYGRMQYEILEKDGLPASLPKAGQIGKSSYADMAQFIASVEKADTDMLHNTFQWQSLDSTMTAGVLIDKTVISLTGPQNGTFYDGVYTVYEMAVLHYSKKVTVTGRVNVYVKHMDSTQCGAIVNDRVVQSAGAGAGKAGIKAYAGADDENVRLEVTGGTKTVYLAKDDYYINLEGTGNGTMNYTVEEMIGEDTKRKVEFLQMALEKDLKYEGYVFEPLGIDKDLYALKALDGSNTVVTPDSDDFRSIFRKITGLSLNQSDTQLDASRTIQLNASLFPLDASNKNLKWTTDNGAVVTVGPDGLVTAAGAGRAVVTVSTLDGSSLKASCVIVVSDGRKEPGNGGSSSGGSGNSGGSGGFVPRNPSAPSQPSVPAVQPSAPSSPSAPSVPADIITGPVVEQLFYIVSFDVNGGKNLSRRTMTLLKDDPLGILPKAQKDRYLFSGWYTQRGGGKEITSGTVLDGATTLYARWTRAEKPGKVKALKLKAGKKKQVKVSFQKVKGARGYQILCSASRKFPASGTKKTNAASRTAVIKNLKKGKDYYIKVRAYTLDSAKNKIYGAYSAVKTVSRKG